jgi:regulatory protein
MATVTALRPTRRRAGYLDLEVDGEPIGPIGEREIAALGLAPGVVLDEASVARLRAEASVAQALALANAYLAHRPRSESELRGRLRQAHHDAATSDAVVERLRAQGLLDDRRFAALWVESRASFSPRSSRALANELRQKGVDREQIDEVLASAVPDDQALALDAGRKRLRQFGGVGEDEFRKRMSGYLSRRGFSYDVVRECVGRLWQESLGE